MKKKIVMEASFEKLVRKSEHSKSDILKELSEVTQSFSLKISVVVKTAGEPEKLKRLGVV